MEAGEAPIIIQHDHQRLPEAGERTAGHRLKTGRPRRDAGKEGVPDLRPHGKILESDIPVREQKEHRTADDKAACYHEHKLCVDRDAARLPALKLEIVGILGEDGKPSPPRTISAIIVPGIISVIL
ncbi:MAG: hypothetical protein ACLUEQ_08175 [Cloacibacillus evryensis]